MMATQRNPYEHLNILSGLPGHSQVRSSLERTRLMAVGDFSQTRKLSTARNIFTFNTGAGDHIAPQKETGNMEGSVLTDTDYVFDGRGGKCNICIPPVHFTSVVNARDHVMGVKHQKALAFHGGLRVLGPDYLIKMSHAAPSPGSSPPRDGHHSPPLQKATRKYEHLFKHHGDEHPIKKLEVEELGEGYCQCCSIGLTSQAHARQHLAGQRHLKNKLMGGSKIATPILKGSNMSADHRSTPTYKEFDDRQCFVCDVRFTSLVTREQHVIGERHLKMKRRIDVNLAAIALSNDIQSINFNDMKEVMSLQPTSLEGDKTKWIWCDLCGVNVNSDAQFEVHIAGKRHRLKEEAKRGGQSLQQSSIPKSPGPVGQGRPTRSPPNGKSNHSPVCDIYTDATVFDMDLIDFPTSQAVPFKSSKDFNTYPSSSDSFGNLSRQPLSDGLRCVQNHEHLSSLPKREGASVYDSNLDFSNFYGPPHVECHTLLSTSSSDSDN